MRIGVFDSGVGGITVLSELRRRRPDVDYVYLGDTANVPYGAKSPKQIERLSAECASVLRMKGVDAVVVACNTASSLALDAIREVMIDVPVFGVVEPGARAALEALSESQLRGSRGPIVVLATRATVKSEAYAKTIHSLSKKEFGSGTSARISVIEQECPLLVPMIEEGWLDHPVLHHTIAAYAGPHLMNHPPGVALLGCTHYPWIVSAFEKGFPGWKVVNSAEAIADAIERSPLMVALNENVDLSRKGKVEWLFTDPDALPAFARQLIRDQDLGLHETKWTRQGTAVSEPAAISIR